jgi:hypothetical protein
LNALSLLVKSKQSSSRARQTSGENNGLDYCGDLRKQLEVLKQEQAAYTDNYNRAPNALRKSKKAIENLER